ncbi:MAG TPA: hypothetical protein VIS99_06455 [Terrimicrobiaceae bacterium]
MLSLQKFILLPVIVSGTLFAAATLSTAAATSDNTADARRFAKPAAAISDVTELFVRAREYVRTKREFRKLAMLEAISLNATPVSSASEITRWGFAFENLSPRSPYRAVYVEYADGKFGDVIGLTAPWLGDADLELPRMKLSAAIKLLRKAGYTEPFLNVTLRCPRGPTELPALYQFTFRVKTDSEPSIVYVNTQSGTVFVNASTAKSSGNGSNSGSADLVDGRWSMVDEASGQGSH